MPTEDELFNLIIERYDTYELLEIVGLDLRDLLAVWDGWLGNPDLLSDLGFEVDDDDEG